MSEDEDRAKSDDDIFAPINKTEEVTEVTCIWCSI